MDKFQRTLRGYDPDEVNAFLDKIIKQVELIIASNKEKDKKIVELSSLVEENAKLKDKLAQYERMEQTLNKAILMTQKTTDQMRFNAEQERDLIISEAKNNANRIVNDALLEAEKTEKEASNLKRNITIFKRKVKDIISAQLEVVDELDKTDL